MNSCNASSKNMDFIMNILIHVLILLCIISGFFFLYVSKLSKSKFQEELNDLISNDLMNTLKNADKTGTLKTLNLGDDIVNFYKNKVDEATVLQNWWLTVITITMVITLIISVAVIVLIMKYSCNQCIPLWHIIKDNLILFFFIGIIEITFFMLIARNFIPVKPSLMINTILERLKSKFQ